MSKESINRALGKIKSARDCHPNAVDTLLFEAEEILEGVLAEQPAQQEIVATGIDAELVARLASATPEQLDIWLVAARRHEARKLQQPPAQPLTDEQLADAWIGTSHITHATSRQIAFARAIEAAHGIKEKT
jgi:hypothetical protein